MSTYDEPATHDQHPEDVPTMRLADDERPTGGPPREETNGSAPTMDPSMDRSATADYAPGGIEAQADRAEVTQPDVEPSSETSLFADGDLAGLRARWDSVQAGFVDDPRDCVHEADALVSDVVGQLTTGFTRARSRLEDQWGRGEEASTEDLRVTLKRYREFFERLLAV
jgi:hypothetical protein